MRLKKRRLVSVGVVGLALVAVLTYGIISIDQRIQSTLRPGGPGKTEWLSPTDSKGEGLVDQTVPVVEVTLNFTLEPVIHFDLEEVRYLSGYIPYIMRKEPEYAMLMVDEYNQTLAGVQFSVSEVIEEPPPLAGEMDNHKALKAGKTVLLLPWHERGRGLQLSTIKGEIINHWTLPQKALEKYPASYETVRGSNTLLRQRLQQGQVVLAPQDHNDSPGEPIDIVYVSEDYTDKAQFDIDVERFTQELLRYEPFTTRGSQIVFHKVYSTGDLGCTYDEVITRLIVCDYALVWQTVHNSQVPYDQVVVVVNNNEYGGSATDYAVAYNGTFGPEVGVHELAHSFGHLLDEYIIYNGGENGGIEKNCLTHDPPDSGWEGLVLPEEYSKGCLYTGWWRTSSTSIMRDISSTFFNKASIKY